MKNIEQTASLLVFLSNIKAGLVGSAIKGRIKEFLREIWWIDVRATP